MTGRGIGFVLALLLIVLGGEAKAWTPFGITERITPLQDVTLTTPGGEALNLGFKTSTVWFLLGVYVSDDGYVLDLRSNPKHYVDMPPPAMLADFQKQGLMPAPLPTYHVGIGDYLVGYSLWLVVVPLLAGYLTYYFAVNPGRRRRRPTRR